MKRVFERADGFAAVCYLNHRFSKFTSLEVALVAVVCALEQLNMLLFRNQWLGAVENAVQLDVVRLTECKRMMVEHLFNTTPEADRSKIECLAKDEIAGLLRGKHREE
jgi:hypothetical protein